jgi:hypothetical protein
MSDSIIERLARKLVSNSIGNYPRINGELCRFENGSPVALTADGSRIEELYTDLKILRAEDGGKIRLNVRADGAAVRWNW